MKKIKIVFLSTLVLSLFFCSCRHEKFDKNKYGNCSDGIQNQQEQNTDCGGPCAPCAGCDDGVKNSGETGIDCGATCRSCAPSCTISNSTVSYTIYPSGFTSSVSSTAGAYSATYFSSQNQINISFSGGSLSSMIINLYPGFDPIAYISQNETMALTTIPYTGSTLSKKNNVTIYYSGSFGFSGFNGAMDQGQVIYMTKTSPSLVHLQFCNLTAGNERFSLNCTFN